MKGRIYNRDIKAYELLKRGIVDTMEKAFKIVDFHQYEKYIERFDNDKMERELKAFFPSNDEECTT